MRKIWTFFIFSLLIFNYGCRQTTNGDSEAPDNLSDGIQTSILEDVGMNKVIINEIIDSINTGFYPNRHSLLIYKNDKLVLEKYFAGKDEKAWAGDIGVIEPLKRIDTVSAASCKDDDLFWPTKTRLHSELANR